MHFLPQSCSSLKLPLWDASVPAFDACSQRWLWQYHTRSVQCFFAAALASCSLAQPACFQKALRTLFVLTDRTVMFPFRTSNVIRSVRSSHLLSSSEISRPSSARVSARSLIGSPRYDFTFIRKVALPARTRCVSSQTISRRISASGAVANVVFPPCPTHFLIAHKTASLSHNRRTSSLRAARTILLLHIISVRPSKQLLMVRTFLKVYMELGSYFWFLQEQIKDNINCNASTTLSNSGLFELVPSSSLPTRAHLPAPSSLNLQHQDPTFPSLHDPSTPNVTP
jgi:hypothetical protein